MREKCPFLILTMLVSSECVDTNLEFEERSGSRAAGKGERVVARTIYCWS